MTAVDAHKHDHLCDLTKRPAFGGIFQKNKKKIEKIYAKSK